MTGDPPRLAPLPPREWAPEMRPALAALRPENPRRPLPVQGEGRPKGLGILGLFAHHPELTHAYNVFNGHVLFASTVEPRERELLVLRTAAVRGAQYEWAQHLVQGADAGLTADEVARVIVGPEAPGWDDLDRALLVAVDELIADARIGDATWATLAASLDTRQIMDAIFTVGAYDLLAMFMLTAGIELDDDLRAYVGRDGMGPLLPG